MNVYDEHKRLLGLVHEQGWFRFSSTDNELLRSLVYGGMSQPSWWPGQTGPGRGSCLPPEAYSTWQI